ncbi:MAG TPA: WYL domain-containing protein [Bacteroidales bacterium]|nr:WYL domain-containing protein [Bacteroidales bacterium]HPO65758.1 WYL domain-containing protein [Bacteroidales bacterium]
MDQPHLNRLIRLMLMLVGNRQSTTELARKLDCNVRTIQRYLESLKMAGLVVEYHQKGIPFLSTSKGPLKQLSDLVQFSEEEAFILHKAIDSIDAKSALKMNLKKKLYNIYHYYPWMAEMVVKPEIGNNVEKLTEAIQAELCVELVSYRSSHSNLVSNRIVEPYEFTVNYEQVWCYEHESQTCKLFNVARIGEVNILQKPWQYREKHQRRFVDIFRNSHYEYIGEIELNLNVRAYNLLIEEYPLSEKYLIQQSENIWYLKAPVCSYEGPARFTLGLLENISILGDNNFLTLINQKIFSLQKCMRQNLSL